MKRKNIKVGEPIKYCIYGIFDFQLNQLIYVDLEIEKVEMEFDMVDYDPERYDIVSFNVLLD